MKIHVRLIVAIAGTLAFSLFVSGCGDDLTKDDCDEICFGGDYNTMDFYNSATSEGGPLDPIERKRCIRGNLSLVDALDDTSDLSCLVEIDGNLTISNNQSLTNLEGLSSLSSVGETVTIADNPELPYCEICTLLLAFSDNFAISSYGNKVDECWNHSAIDCTSL